MAAMTVRAVKLGAQPMEVMKSALPTIPTASQGSVGQRSTRIAVTGCESAALIETKVSNKPPVESETWNCSRIRGSRGAMKFTVPSTTKWAVNRMASALQGISCAGSC